MAPRGGSIICGLALILLASALLAAAEELALERDILGYFRPAKRPPAAFSNIAELHLAGRGEYGWKALSPYFGMIKTRGTSATTYPLRPPVITGLKIQFTSDVVRGVSYEFSGVLTRADFSGDGIPIDEVMLRGTMRKLKNGRQIAVGEIQFFFETGG